MLLLNFLIPVNISGMTGIWGLASVPILSGSSLCLLMNKFLKYEIWI